MVRGLAGGLEDLLDNFIKRGLEARSIALLNEAVVVSTERHLFERETQHT